jgi:hypothetical protein
VIEACYLMRDRFLSEEVWERLGLDVEDCVKFLDASPLMREFRRMLFTRIVPTLKDIGLWGPRVRETFVKMDVMNFAEANLDELFLHDEAVAVEFDKLRTARDKSVQEVIAQA